jgi:hypothetical protein
MALDHGATDARVRLRARRTAGRTGGTWTCTSAPVARTWRNGGPCEARLLRKALELREALGLLLDPSRPHRLPELDQRPRAPELVGVFRRVRFGQCELYGGDLGVDEIEFDLFQPFRRRVLQPPGEQGSGLRRANAAEARDCGGPLAGVELVEGRRQAAVHQVPVEKVDGPHLALGVGDVGPADRVHPLGDRLVKRNVDEIVHQRTGRDRFSEGRSREPGLLAVSDQYPFLANHPPFAAARQSSAVG